MKITHWASRASRGAIGMALTLALATAAMPTTLLPTTLLPGAAAQDASTQDSGGSITRAQTEPNADGAPADGADAQPAEQPAGGTGAEGAASGNAETESPATAHMPAPDRTDAASLVDDEDAESEFIEHKHTVTLTADMLTSDVLTFERTLVGEPKTEYAGPSQVTLNGAALGESNIASFYQDEDHGGLLSVKLKGLGAKPGDTLVLGYLTERPTTTVTAPEGAQVPTDPGAKWVVNNEYDAFALRPARVDVRAISNTFISDYACDYSANPRPWTRESALNDNKPKACLPARVDHMDLGADNDPTMYVMVGNYAPNRDGGSWQTIEHRTINGRVGHILVAADKAGVKLERSGQTALVEVGDDAHFYVEHIKGDEHIYKEHEHFEVIMAPDSSAALIKFKEPLLVEDYEYLKISRMFKNMVPSGTTDVPGWAKAELWTHMKFEETRDIGYCVDPSNTQAGDPRLRKGRYTATEFGGKPGAPTKTDSVAHFALRQENKKYSIEQMVDPKTLLRLPQSRQAARTSSDQLASEKQRGTTAYIVKSDPSSQYRNTSQLFRQVAGSNEFEKVGEKTGWILNALAYNPEDHWLYAISQPRLGHNVAEKTTAGRPILDPRFTQGTYDITPKEDPCYPTGHLLQIDPETGEIFDLGRVLRDGDVRNDSNRYHSNHGFMGIPRAEHPNDLYGGINVGVFGSGGNYLVSNGSSSGTGTIYKVSLGLGGTRPNAKPWISPFTDRRTSNSYSPNSEKGRAFSEDYTPIFDDKGQNSSANYIWGIQNRWISNKNNRVYLERISLSTGVSERFDITDLKTKYGQSVPAGHQWGKAWAYGNNILGFGTASSGSSADLVQIRIEKPNEANLANAGIQLVGRDGLAPESYNSNGTSVVVPHVVDLEIFKTRHDLQDGTVRWDITVKNMTADQPSTGFSVYDTIPRGFTITGASENRAAPVNFDASGRVSPPGGWSVYRGASTNNTLIEALHGRLGPLGEVTLSLYGKPTSTTVLECTENVVGVVGIDKDPKSETLEDLRKELEKNGLGYADFIARYGDLASTNQGVFGDLAFDNYCKGRLTIIKNTEVDGVETQRVDGWKFTANVEGAHKVLIDAGVNAKPEKLASSNLTTGQSGMDKPGVSTHEKGQVSWIVQSTEPQKIRVTEDLAAHPGFKLELDKLVCRKDDGSGQNIPDNWITKDPGSNSFVVDMQATNRMLPKVACEVLNVKRAEEGSLTLQKKSYDPLSGKPVDLPLEAGWEFRLGTKGTSFAADKQNVEWFVLNKEKFTAEKLKAGNYVLVETAAPANHSLLAQAIEFELKRNTAGKLELANLTNGGGLVTFENPTAERPNILLTVADPQTGGLPRTGGHGIWVWALAGMLLIGAGALNLRRRLA